jgi:hypothetical protein
MHPTKVLLAISFFSPSLGCEKPIEEEETGEVQKATTLEGAVRSDLLGSNTGLLWSTDLSLDMAILREVGTGFTFLSAELAIWGERGGGGGGQNPALNNCMSEVDSSTSNGTTTTKIMLDDCFVGANRNRRMGGEITAKRHGNNLEIETVWNFEVGAISLSGTFNASWQNVKNTAIPEATFSLEAVSDGNTYNHRTFSVSQGVVGISDRYENPPKYEIPGPDGEGFGASLSWDNREDRLDFGLILKNSNGRYSGDFWGDYTGESGQTLAFSDGQLEETQDKDLILNLSGVSQGDNQTFELTELKQTWGNQTASFTGELSFSYEVQGSLDIGDSSTSYGLLAYTVTPLALVGADYSTTINGAIESALYVQDENQEDQEVWTFGLCEELSQGRDDQFGSAGTCTFNNAEGGHLGLYFSEETPSTGWLLVEKAPEQWLCRNLNSGEERELGSSQDAPSDCLE